MDNEVVMLAMTRAQIDYAKEAAQDKHSLDQTQLGLDTVLILRKAADAPKAEDRAEAYRDAFYDICPEAPGEPDDSLQYRQRLLREERAAKVLGEAEPKG